MIYHLDNASVQLVLKPAQGFWSVISRQRNGGSLEDAQLGIRYRQGRVRSQGLSTWLPFKASPVETRDSAHGPLRQITLGVEPDNQRVLYRLTFALPVDHPLLLWRITVQNQGAKPFLLDQLDLLQVGYPKRTRPRLPTPGALSGRLHDFIQYQGAVRPYPDPGEPAFFSNGWQSWNHTGVYGLKSRFRRTRLGPLTTPMRVNPGNPHPRQAGHFVSEMFAVVGDRTHRSGILVGFLSQKQHFGSVDAWLDQLRPSLRLWANGDGARLDPGDWITTDWACLQFLHLDAPDPLGPYLEAVAREHGMDGFGGATSGWCSWYSYGERVTAVDVQQNLEAARALQPAVPLDIIQIDDGFSATIGDWSSSSVGFPEGVAPLAKEIRAAGFKPGLWLAPFILHPRSRLRAEHPDWVLRNLPGFPVNAGFKWNAFTQALDLTHPDALQYVRNVVHTAVHQWGFEYLKLDHLYAGALRGWHRDPTRTRAQVLRAGLEAIRSAAGEKAFLLACGCPLGPAIGLVDAMRIGADVDVHWQPTHEGHPLLVRGEPDYPAARNAIQNALTRASLHRRWWINDPDCLLLNPENPLSWTEVQSLATVIALTGGATLVSDPLPDLPPERLRVLRAMLPAIDRVPHVLDWFDRPTPSRLQLDLQGPPGTWHLLALFNWDDRPQDLTLKLNEFYLDPRADYLARDFWRGETFLISGGSHALGPVPAHGVALLALRRHSRLQPIYLGGELHISQGLEVSGWAARPDGLSFRLSRPGRDRGQIDLYLPAEPTEVDLDGVPIAGQSFGPGCYRFTVDIDQTAQLDLQWKTH